jgi:hypothetical protein
MVEINASDRLVRFKAADGFAPRAGCGIVACSS